MGAQSAGRDLFSGSLIVIARRRVKCEFWKADIIQLAAGEFHNCPLPIVHCPLISGSLRRISPPHKAKDESPLKSVFAYFCRLAKVSCRPAMEGKEKQGSQESRLEASG